MHAGGDISLGRRHHVGVGRKRALHIVERREQGLRGLTGFAGDDPDPMPLRARIEQIDGAGRALPANLDAGDLVADLERQIELRLGLARSTRQREGHFAERLAAAGDGPDHASARAFGSAQDPGGESASLACGLVQRKRRIVPVRAEHQDAARRAGKLGQAVREGPALAIVETIGKPHDAIVRLAAKLALKHVGKRLAVWCVRLRCKSGSTLARLLGGDRADERVAGRGRREHHGPAVAHGTVYCRVDHLAPLRPMGGRSPAIVDNEQQRTGSGKALAVGIEHRAGERKHDEGGKQHAERREPPGTVRRGLLGRFQVLQQPRRREHHMLRRRRCQPQQPPDRGKSRETKQHPGLKEADGAEAHHDCDLASVAPAARGVDGRKR